jgi:hypothetical protein
MLQLSFSAIIQFFSGTPKCPGSYPRLGIPALDEPPSWTITPSRLSATVYRTHMQLPSMPGVVSTTRVTPW